MADALLPVEEAIARVTQDVLPTAPETVPLGTALNRILAEPLAARRTQPPFDVSAMDGYAVRAADVATQGYRPGAIELTGALLTMLALIGANLAGRQPSWRPSKLVAAVTRS